ncbi:MAG: hypothetical protein ACOVMM_11955 [Chitinophagaceae bacterium]
MKKIIIAAIALVSFSTLKAQPPMGGTPPTKEQMEQRRIKNEANLVASFKELELTDDQIIKVREVLKEAQAKGGEVRRDESLDREAKRAKNKEIDDARDAKLKELLGEEKFTKWQAIRKRQMEEMRKAAMEAQAPSKE